MAVKVLFEVGHTSKLKSKQTPDGFTHDWELYVRGIDKNDISHFVEKVVFNLHESFPKPKRVIKEAPYILKESGYAGFLVPTEIHFKARDQRVSFTYDLSLQHAGPPVHRSEIKKFTLFNPSEEFRRKLLKGGGIPLVNNTTDDKSRDSLDDRSQGMIKPKINTDEVAKKHKIRPDESKSQTFAKLFGPPITKTTSKVSPDGKSKSSPSPAAAVVASKSSKSTDKVPSVSSTSKEKPDKVEKKDKHKNSPHKDKYEGKDSKKGDDKHERREDKKKDKSHSKERDRSHDKGSKRPPSPKRPPPSPKRPSPVRSSSSASRGGGDTNGYKASTKTHTDNVGLNNNAEKVTSSSGGGKKSKKEKKSYDKEKERDKNKEKDRDRKEKALDDRSSNNSTPVVPGVMPANHTLGSSQTIAVSKLPNTEAKASTELIKNKEKEILSQNTSKDATKESGKKGGNIDTNSNLADSKKLSEKHEKDEKRHKHKKKDKSKEKEKEKEHISSKDSKKKEKSLKKDEIKKTPQASSDAATVVTSQKSNPTQPANTLLHRISDDDTRDSISESVSASISERHESFAESSNSSVNAVSAAAAAATTTTTQHPPPPILAPATEDFKTDRKDRKNRDKLKTDKDEKKRKRKSKDDVDSIHKATPPPPTLLPEPPIKQLKKDELIMKNGDRSNSPHLSNMNSSGGVPNPSPKTQHLVDDSKAFRTPSAANVPLPSTSSNSTNSSSAASQATSHPDRPFTVDYISELRDLQQKIMTLQDSNDLQQVVELIAPTGRFEITNKSFDFDLCTLDRNTVQKLQDFFATTCS